MEDNTALSAASKKAKEAKGHLITVYLFAPKEMDWHGTSPARTDFILQSLQLLQKQLAEKHIPLAFVTAEERKDKVSTVLRFTKEHDISHVYANIEHEVDELRRDIKFAKHIQEEKDMSFQALHDQVVVKPGELKTGAGGPMKVFTPYHRAWLAEVSSNRDLIKLQDPPAANETSASKDLKALFDSTVPSLPESKQYDSPEDQQRIRALWPPGHAAGLDRLHHFLAHKVANYARDRSDAAKDPSSRLSCYFSTGALSVREALTVAAAANSTGADFSTKGDAGISAWVREIVFREFYRQMLVVLPHNAMNLPHNAMNLPQNLKFDNVRWEADEEGWYKWCEGRTGVPFVDAGMRQLVRSPSPLKEMTRSRICIAVFRMTLMPINPPLLSEHRSIHAQPPAHEHRKLPTHEPADRLPQRRALLRRAPRRLGSRQQHARLGA